MYYLYSSFQWIRINDVWEYLPSIDCLNHMSGSSLIDIIFINYSAQDVAKGKPEPGTHYMRPLIPLLLIESISLNLSPHLFYLLYLSILSIWSVLFIFSVSSLISVLSTSIFHKLDLFLKAAEKAGVDPQHAIVIEDSIMGLRAAKAAKAFAIGVCGFQSFLSITNNQLNGWFFLFLLLLFLLLLDNQYV